MQNIHRLAQQVLRKLHEPISSDPNGWYPWANIFQALNSAKDVLTSEMVLLGERYRTLLFPADTWALYSTPASGNRVATMPANFIRAAVVEVLVGSQYYPIEEDRPIEGRSWPSPEQARSLSRDTGYYFEGESLFLNHDSSGVVANGVRVRMERSCPDLLVGQPATAATASTNLVLAQSDNEAIGQLAASMDDHAYLGLYLTWIPKLDPEAVTDTNGGLLNTRNRIVGYTGASFTAAMETAWTDPPLPAVTDTYAMMTPFPDAIDRLLVYKAAALLQADAGEDPSGHEASFFSGLETWMEVMDQRSSAQRRFRPYEDDPD